MLETTPRSGELLGALRGLTDEELVKRLKGLSARERRATALVVAHLAEFDTRDVYLRAGYSSLFSYCCDVLALSEHEALNRIDAARTARRFPVVLELLASAEINLTTVRLLGPHLTADNHVAVLAAARGKRKAGVEEIVARLSPRADVPASVRKLPQASAAIAPAGGSSREAKAASGSGGSSPELAAALGAAGGSSLELKAASGPADDPVLVAAEADASRSTAQDAYRAPVRAGCAGSGSETVLAALPHVKHAAEVTPLSPDRYKYQLTIGGTTLEKLRLAKDMLRHALPSGGDEAVLDRALTALLIQLARKKFGAEPMKGSAPKKGSTAEKGASPDGPAQGGRSGIGDSRYVPVGVKRAVWVRDLGRCAFVGTNGHRCGERAFVEFHHLRPYAVGGTPTVHNIELRCRRHNGYEARVFFAREPVEEDELREPVVVPERVPVVGTIAPASADASPRLGSGGGGVRVSVPAASV